MELVKSVINLITFLIMFGLGVKGLDMATKAIKGEAIKAHERGVISLQKWNLQLIKNKVVK